MNNSIMSLMVIGANIFPNILTLPPVSVGLPSKQEQSNLLLNVQEIFEEIKALANDEGSTTLDSVIGDAEKMVRRSQDKLSLVEEMALIKISCIQEEGCMDVSTAIKQKVERGISSLEECTKEASREIRINSNELWNITATAMDKGQLFLDLLGACARKPPLQLLSCYKKVIVDEVLPTKIALVTGIQAHKTAHFKSITIRNKANDCVDVISLSCQQEVARLLADALACRF